MHALPISIVTRARVIGTGGVQENGTKNPFPLHVTIFDALHDDEKKAAESSGEEMLRKIPYHENLYKAIFYDLKKRDENDYVFNKAEYPMTVTTVQIIILSHQPKNNYNRQSTYHGVITQLMIVQCGKTEDD